ncbi:hypothetical protein JVU11DRAFT_7398 [Chiua virens]|nr:hypothetical protein JVU11DRAFT_7398 [Chiua virens]
MPLRRSHTPISPTASGVPSDQTPSGSNRVEYAHSASPPMNTRESSVDQYPTRIHILSTKIQPGVLDELVSLVERSTTALSHGDRVGSHLELATDSDHADVIVTAIHTKPRLERHITWDVAKTKAIVTPDWLRDSVSSGTIQPCGKYAALRGLQDGTERVCPEAKTTANLTPRASPNYRGQIPIFVDPEASVKETDLAALNYLSQFCCQRASTLICPNQSLVEELDIIRRERMFEGEERSMLSYARAIATIKAYPYRFNNQASSEDIAKLPYLGVKLTSMVKEFTETGKILEAQNILSSTRFLSLSVFNSIHGIGPHTAKHLYSIGLRTNEDLEKYYEVSPAVLTSESSSSHPPSSDSKEIGVEKSIQISLSLRHDFSQKISRHESEEISRVVTQELESIEPGSQSLIVGGYRRGKLESNDVDILISHCNHGADKVRGLCKKLTQRLHERGFVKHVLNMSGHHPHDGFRMPHHLDSLEKALTVFLLPDDPACKRIHRRVDLIFATPGVFWAAVVGWTGSTMFQRDLRLWAKKQK